MRLYLDQDLVIADLDEGAMWNETCERSALEYARSHEVDFVLVFRGSTCLRVMLVPPDSVAA